MFIDWFYYKEKDFLFVLWEDIFFWSLERIILYRSFERSFRSGLFVWYCLSVLWEDIFYRFFGRRFSIIPLRGEFATWGRDSRKGCRKSHYALAMLGNKNTKYTPHTKVEPLNIVAVQLWICVTSQQFAYTALAQFLLASSYIGNLLQPTHKRFNSAYLQNTFCICSIPSNTLGLDATFSCWSQVTMMFQ